MSASRKNSIDGESVKEIERRLYKDDSLTPFESKVRPEQLTTIYRSAKTHEQLEKDDRDREALFKTRVAKYLPIKVTLIASTLFFLTANFLMSIEAMWFAGQAGIFASFLLAILLLFAYYFIYGYLDKSMYQTGRSMAKFGMVYGFLVAASIAVGAITNGVAPGLEIFGAIVSATVFHILAVLVFTTLLFKTR